MTSENAKRARLLRLLFDPDVEGKRVETHHIKPRFLGGIDNKENLIGYTLPEHAYHHYREGIRARDERTRIGHSCAVRKIMGRMSPEERDEFMRMVEIARKRG